MVISLSSRRNSAVRFPRVVRCSKYSDGLAAPSAFIRRAQREISKIELFLGMINSRDPINQIADLQIRRIARGLTPDSPQASLLRFRWASSHLSSPDKFSDNDSVNKILKSLNPSRAGSAGKSPPHRHPAHNFRPDAVQRIYAIGEAGRQPHFRACPKPPRTPRPGRLPLRPLPVWRPTRECRPPPCR